MRRRSRWTSGPGRRRYVAYATVGVLTATTFIFGGLLREQVCIYMCPWPRIQTAMAGRKIAAGHLQGLARRTARQRQGADKRIPAHLPATPHRRLHRLQPVRRGLPDGIDIREGPQIGCITCALLYRRVLTG